MGLPNGSLSQARRVEVVSWERPGEAWMSYLDVDEIVAGEMNGIPRPVKIGLNVTAKQPSGTLVTLSRCDRLDFKRANKLVSRLRRDLGRLFRRSLANGGRISINGENLVPIDPTFLLQRDSEQGAKPFGPPLEYRIRFSDDDSGDERVALVKVVFAELPLRAWHSLSNEEKNRRGIAKGAGVAILRAGREIDYGWFFMGNKRRENYDDWWRCEISFPPDLDDLFGVTHTKQRIRPNDQLVALLSPDLERIARELNNRVRKLYATIREQVPRDKLLDNLSRKDVLLEPPSSSSRARIEKSGRLRVPKAAFPGMSFQIKQVRTDSRMFYEPIRKGSHLTLSLNQNHPFNRVVFGNLASASQNAELRKCMQTLLLAAARSESTINGIHERETMKRFRRSWSDSLVAFLT